MQYNGDLKNRVISKFNNATKQINSCKSVQIKIPSDFEGRGTINSALTKIKAVNVDSIKGEFERVAAEAEAAEAKANQNSSRMEFIDNHDVYHQVKADKDKNNNTGFSIDFIIKWGKSKINEIYKTGAGVVKYTKDTVNTLTNFNWTDVNEKAKLDSNSDKMLKDNMNKLQHKKESDSKELDGIPGIGTIRKYLTGNVLQELNQKTKLSSEDEAYMNKQLQKYREQKKKEMEQTTLATAASDILNATIALAEGAGNFAEATIDALNIMNAKVKENEIRYEMQYRGHEPYKSDKDAEKAINKLWETTMEDVEKKKVKSFFDDAYKKNELLKKVNVNSDKVFQRDGIMYVFVEGLGYYVPIIATGIFTGGGSAAVAATTATTAISAFGKYTGEYWSDAKANSWEGITEAYKKGEISKEQYETYKTIRNMSDEDIRYLKNNGYISEEEYQIYKEIREIPEDWKTEENRKKGMQYGTLNAFWEGVQTATGATLALNPLGINQLARTGINIATDAIFNAADTPFRAYVDTQMNNNVTFNEAFEARGGWGAVARDAAIGATLSAIGEIDNLSQATKDGTLFTDISENNSEIRNIDPLNNSNSEIIDWDKTIEKVNYQAKNGNVMGIEIKDLNEIPERFFNQIDDPSSVFFIKDGKNISYSRAKYSLENMNSMKREILLNVCDIDSETLKAKAIYEELNKRVHYDFTYNRENADIQAMIVNKVVSFDELNDAMVICKGWSELYLELLDEQGIDAKIVKANDGNHWWVEIQLKNGRTIVADATAPMGVPGKVRSTDLINSKTGVQSNGFFFIDDTQKGIRPSQISKTDQMMNEVRDIDIKLGYADEFGYGLDKASLTKETFKSKLYDKIMKKSKATQTIEILRNMEIPNDLDGYDLFGKYELLNESHKLPTSVDTHLLFYGNEAVCQINVYDSITGNSYYELYSKSLGKRTFDNLPELLEFHRAYNITR